MSTPIKYPGEVSAMPRRRKTIIEETTATPEEVKETRATSPTLEAWIAEQAARPEVAVIRVAKRGPTGRWVWLRPYDLQPPFTGDLEPIFRTYGDGLYRFVPINASGGMLGSHQEEILGYGRGTGSANFAGPPGGGPEDDVAAAAAAAAPADEEISLRELIQMERERLVLESLRRARGEDRAQGGGTDMERLAAVVASMTQAMASAFQPLAQMMSARMDATGKLLEVIVPRLTSEPQPVDKLIDAMSKVLDLRERALPEGGGGLDDYLRPLLGVLVAQLAQRLAGPAAAGPAAVAPMVPGPAAPVMPTGAPVAVPSAPAPMEPSSGEAGVPAWLVAAIVDAAARGDRDWELWADLLEHRLPGVVHIWAQTPVEAWLGALGQAVPEFGRPEVQAWLREFHAALRQGGTAPA